MIMPSLWQSLTSPSLLRPQTDPEPVHVGFAVDKLAWYRFFSRYFGFPLSVSFHHCSIFILFYNSSAIQCEKLRMLLNTNTFLSLSILHYIKQDRQCTQYTTPHHTTEPTTICSLMMVIEPKHVGAVDVLTSYISFLWGPSTEKVTSHA